MVAQHHSKKRSNARSRTPSKATDPNLQRQLVHKQKSKRRPQRDPAVMARAAIKAKRPLWSLIAKQTAQTVLGDGRYIETRRVPVSPALADLPERSQHLPAPSTQTWHIVHDISVQVRSSVQNTTFHPSSEVIPHPTPSPEPSTPTIIEFSKHSTPAAARRLYLTDSATRHASAWSSTAPAIGVLSCASGFRPGSGVLKGSSTSDATLARNTSLLASLASPPARSFYTAARFEAKQHLAAPLMPFPPPPVLYSPSVVGFRRADDDRFDLFDRDFNGERDAIPADPTTRELESPPAVEPQSQRPMGEYVSPYLMDVVSMTPVSLEVVRTVRAVATDPAAMANRVRTTLKPRIAHALRMFAARGVRTVVLGAFGVEDGVPVDALAQIYTELFVCKVPGDEGDEVGTFRDTFSKVVFAIPGKHSAPFQKAFEMRKYEDELVGALME